MPLWTWIASRLGLKAERSEAFVAAARLTILWERLWRASWPASGIIGLFAAAGLFDLFAVVPQWLHLWALFFALLAAGSLLHRNLKGLAFPSWADGARRVEHDSALDHRPLSEGHDRLAAGAGDPWTEELWRAHLRRLLARIDRLKLTRPRPGLQARDRYALRFLVALLLAGGFVTAGGDWSKRLATAFTPDAGASSSAVFLDAWINPPPYTGQAPLYLQHPADGGSVAVPAGSELALRVHAARGRPNLSLEPNDGTARFSGSSGEYAANIVLAGDGDLRVLADGKLLARLHIAAVADKPPAIAFLEPPAKTEHDAVKFAFKASDDYGVVSARAIIRPVASNAHGVLSVDLPLAAAAKTVTQSVYRDLTGEPLAGVDVEIVLEAKDGAGQTGLSKPMRMRLPARVFTTPLARALIEQRQNLAVGAPHARDNALLALDALTIAPERFYDRSHNVYLAIRAAYWSLKDARSADDVAEVEQLLWDTAVGLEQGGLLSAAERLRETAQLLAQALAQGAPQEVIAALLERYRQALQQYLQALAQNAPQQNGNNALSSNAKTLTPQDLDALLKAIEQMAQTGSREGAAQALAMLQNLIENLRVTQGTGGAAGGDKALSDAIQGLGDLIGRQRQLLDKSFRQGQGAGDPKDGGPKGLAGEQGRLREDLDKILKGLGPKKAPHALGEAERQMGQAQNRLGAGDFDGAGQAQKNALDALRQSADALAKSLLAQGPGTGAAGASGPDTDPLGRQEGSNGFGTGDGVKIPDRDSLARARAILEELRRRAAERGRPKEELDYYDRLLKAF